MDILWSLVFMHYIIFKLKNLCFIFVVVCLIWCQSGEIVVGQADFSCTPDRLSCKVWKTFINSGVLGFRSKGQILTCQFQRFLYQSLCVFSQIKDRKQIEENFHAVARVMPRGGTWGCWGGGFLVNSYLSQLVPKSTRTHFWSTRT